jgi:excinuclease UvrABC nuclease subunit
MIGKMQDTEITELLNGSIPQSGVCSGVYFLFDKDELVYIGSGWNCFLRVAEHTRKEQTHRVNFTRWNFKPITGKENYVREEKRLIKKYQPKGNKAHNCC